MSSPEVMVAGVRRCVPDVSMPNCARCGDRGCTLSLGWVESDGELDVKKKVFFCELSCLALWSMTEALRRDQ